MEIKFLQPNFEIVVTIQRESIFIYLAFIFTLDNLGEIDKVLYHGWNFTQGKSNKKKIKWA